MRNLLIRGLAGGLLLLLLLPSLLQLLLPPNLPRGGTDGSRMASLLNASSTFLFIDTSTAAHMLTSSVLEGRPRLLNSLFKLADDELDPSE